MGLVPYGYRLGNSGFHIDDAEADRVRELFRAYTSGLSFEKAGRKAGIGCSLTKLKSILSDRVYLGNDDFPRIIEDEVFESARAERARRMALLNGRNSRPERKSAVVFKAFRITDRDMVTETDPKLRAEILYSMIEKEE